jgi:hypothetical protein
LLKVSGINKIETPYSILSNGLNTYKKIELPINEDQDFS